MFLRIPSHFGNWLKENTPTVLAILGALVFASQYAVVVRFYSAFGVAPEELGIQYLDMLARAASIGIMVLLSGCLLGVVFGIGSWLTAKTQKKSAMGVFQEGFLFGSVLVVTFFGVASTIGYFDAVLFGDQSEGLRRGVNFQGGGFGAPVRADAIELAVPLDGSVLGLGLQARRLRLLSRTAETTILLDLDSLQVFRLPSDKLALVTRLKSASSP